MTILIDLLSASFNCVFFYFNIDLNEGFILKHFYYFFHYTYIVFNKKKKKNIKRAHYVISIFFFYNICQAMQKVLLFYLNLCQNFIENSFPLI